MPGINKVILNGNTIPSTNELEAVIESVEIES